MREKLIALVALLAVVALVAGCGGGGADDGAATTAAATEEAPATGDEADGEPDADPCANDLQVVNAAGETAAEVPDGEFATATMWADQGPHPDNTVDYDGSLELAFFTTEQEPDPQFGISIPIDPDTPDGEHFVSIRLSTDGVIGADQVYVDRSVIDDRDDADGTIIFSYWEYGSIRLLPGNFEMTITELTDEVVCGEIATTTQTELQQFIGLEGTFVADRSQYLESLDG
jgi:hypothetical protein